MKLQGLQNFLAIVEAGSIRAAAKQLGLSQPALTRSLQVLEKELGAQLLRRGVHGISLTTAGNAFAVRARNAQLELDKGVAEARRGGEDSGVMVTFAISAIARDLLLPELAVTMQRSNPEVGLRIMEMFPSPLMSIFRDTPVDFVLTQRTKANLEIGLRYKPLFDIQLRIAARPGHPLAGRRHLRDLAEATWLGSTAPGNANDRVTFALKAAGLPPPFVAVHCGSMHHLADIAAHSDMLVQLPPQTLKPLVKSGRLIEIPLIKPLPMLRVGLYSRSESPPTPAGKAAIQIMTAISRRYAASGELRSAEPIVAR